MVPYRKDAPAHMPFSTNFEFKQIIKFESFIMLGRTFCNMYNKQIKSSFVLHGCVYSVQTCGFCDHFYTINQNITQLTIESLGDIY